MISQDPEISIVLKVLELSDQGMISQSDVKEAIKSVVKAAGNSIN